MSQNYVFPLKVGTGGNGETPDLSGYQKLLSGTEGQLVGFDVEGKAIATNVNLDYADFKTTTVTDMNNLKEDGLYNFNSAITNSPPYMDRFSVEVFTYYRYVVQKAFGFKASTNSSATTSIPAMYVRMYDTMLYSWTSWNLVNKSAVDGALSSASINPVQNKVIYDALTKKQDKLTGIASQLVGFNENGEAVAVNFYSDSADDVTLTYSVKNTTLGTDITSQFSDLFSVKHIKLGKLHFLEIVGGKKIYSTTTATYQMGLSISIPIYFSTGFELTSSRGSGLTNEIVPVISLGTNQLSLTFSYTQSNSTSQYSPDSIYQMKSVLMFIEN